MPFSPLLKQVARRTGILFLIFLAATIIPVFVEFQGRYDQRIQSALSYIAVIAFFAQVGLWANTFIAYSAGRYVDRHGSERGERTTIRAAAMLAKVTVWALLFLMALERLGHNVTGLIAGLGVGGIAVAFALQNILGDLFAALSIVTDKPFVIGDAIQVDEFSGKVERIGLKSTRVRSDSGEQIIFGNGDLLKGRIRNYGRMNARTAIITTRVSATTPVSKLDRIPAIVGDIIRQQPDTRFIRCTLTGIGDFTVDFTTVYSIASPDYQLYADSQQAVLLDIVRRFGQEEIQLASQLEAAVRERWVTAPPPVPPHA